MIRLLDGEEFCETLRRLEVKMADPYFDWHRQEAQAAVDAMATMTTAEWVERYLPHLAKLSAAVDEAHRPLEGAELHRAIRDEFGDVSMARAADEVFA